MDAVTRSKPTYNIQKDLEGLTKDANVEKAMGSFKFS